MCNIGWEGGSAAWRGLVVIHRIVTRLAHEQGIGSHEIIRYVCQACKVHVC